MNPAGLSYQRSLTEEISSRVASCSLPLRTPPQNGVKTFGSFSLWNCDKLDLSPFTDSLEFFPGCITKRFEERAHNLCGSWTSTDTQQGLKEPVQLQNEEVAPH